LHGLGHPLFHLLFQQSSSRHGCFEGFEARLVVRVLDAELVEESLHVQFHQSVRFDGGDELVQVDVATVVSVNLGEALIDFVLSSLQSEPDPCLSEFPFAHLARSVFVELVECISQVLSDFFWFEDILWVNSEHLAEEIVHGSLNFALHVFETSADFSVLSSVFFGVALGISKCFTNDVIVGHDVIQGAACNFEIREEAIFACCFSHDAEEEFVTVNQCASVNINGVESSLDVGF